MDVESDGRSVTSESSQEVFPEIGAECIPLSSSTPRKDSVADSEVDNVSLVPYDGSCHNMVVPNTQQYSHTQRSGDVDMEQKVFDRMDQLGILEKKKHLEKQLAERLEREMEKGDHIVGAINRSRRQREVRDRVNSVKDEIHNTIRTRVHDDGGGVKYYKVQILMGRFTRNVRHSVEGNEVFICGSTPNGSCLQKETQIEFPKSVDMSKMDASFKAGVFKMQVPFLSQSSLGSMTSSSCDEAAVFSGTDTCSTEDPFSESEADTSSQDGRRINGCLR